MKIAIKDARQAAAIERRARQIREEFEAEQRTQTPDQEEAEIEFSRMGRSEDQAISREADVLDDLYTAIERRLLPRIERLERGGVDRAVSDETDTPATSEPDQHAKDLANDRTKSGADMLAELNARVEQQQREIDVLTRQRTEAQGIPGYDHQREQDPEKRFSIVRATIGYLSNWAGWDDKLWPERELIDAYSKKAMLAGVSSTGGFYIAPQWMGDVIELLRPNTVSIQLGARVLPNFTGGPVTWPKLKGGASAFWVAEGKKATKSQQQLGSVNLTPKPLVAVVPMSEDLIDSTGGEAQSIVEEDMALALAEALDRGILIGGGGEGQPLGIVNSPGVGTNLPPGGAGGLNSGAMQDVTDWLDSFIYNIAARDAFKGTMGWAMHPSAAQVLRQVKDANGNTILFNAIQPGAGRTNDIRAGDFYGYPFGLTTQLAFGDPTDLIFGNWNDILLGRWGATKVLPSMEASDPSDGSSAFLERQVWIRMSARVDSALRHGESFEIGDQWNGTIS